MKILHLNDKLELKGGVEVYIDQLFKYSNEFNLNSDWVAIQKSSKTHYKFVALQAKETSFDNLTALTNHLKNYCEKKNIDIIHIHSISNPSLIRELFKIRPVVRSMHEPRIVCPGQGKFWRKTERVCDQPFGLHCLFHAYKEGCCNRHPKRLIEAYNNVKFETTEGKQNYKAIIAMSQYMIDEALKVEFKKDQLSLNPYFTDQVAEKDLLDQSNAETKSIIFIGRLSKTKGVHYFIECGILLLEEGHNVRLDIVGDGHDAEYFKGLVPEDKKQFFIFHGWQSRKIINELLTQSYLMVFPSIYPEAFGISGIEAMMRGKPVVGFDVGGVPSWLKDGETGSLVEAKKSNQLTSKVTELIENTEMYKRYSKNARETCLQEFAVERHMKLLTKTYKKALN